MLSTSTNSLFVVMNAYLVFKLLSGKAVQVIHDKTACRTLACGRCREYVHISSCKNTLLSNSQHLHILF